MKRGFTLVEVIISIAIVVVLLAGVNYIFSMAGKTAGSAQETLRQTRDYRAAQSVLASDFRGYATDGPALVIRGSIRPAYESDADAKGDIDDAPNPQNPLTMEGDPISPYKIHFRNHRQDILGFFARGLFQRQTGADSTSLVTNGSSNEAWIVYAHASMPPGFLSPGAGDASTNRDNFYASQWILARRVMLLRDWVDAAGSPQGYYAKSAVPVSPLGANSDSIPSGSPLIAGRYDVARTSIDAMRSIIAAGPVAWYNLITYRPRVNPFVGTVPNPDTVAQSVPIFLDGCGQFIVEYAGDFLAQDATGVVTDTYIHYNADGTTQLGSTDNELDFVVDSGVKRIRWYGLPRDVNGDGKIDLNDVVPLRDLWQTFPSQATMVPVFEKVLPPIAADYAPGPAGSYTCAWRTMDRRPMMLRITIATYDPKSRVLGAIHEQVYNLGG